MMPVHWGIPEMFTIRLVARTILVAVSVLGLVGVLPASQDKPAASLPEFGDLDEFQKSLPVASVKPLDLDSALLFSALPLACLDDLQPRPSARPYFWQPTYRIVDNHDKTRAFYGCNDWQTAVGATWTLVTLLKRYPDLAVSGLIREKLTDHLGRQNLEGELAYFKTAGNFQRPYGYAWFLKLHAELATWKDPDGARYAENTAPLARFFADSLVSYLIDIERPNRAAGQANTAFTLGLLLDYVDVARDMTIGRAVREAARRAFMTDTECATNTEAAVAELISPCLAEAAVMSRTLDQAAFIAWFDKFFPPLHSAKFKSLRTVTLEADATGRGARGGPPANPHATWAGLAFTRADAFLRIAAALPVHDPRVAVLKKLAAIHAEIGQRGLSAPAAFDAPWLGTFALSYLMTTGNQQ
ncbi:MAG: DUF2891 family protein [Acidobacteria bacterium]|nr:DUF2891 family protein [Acidobacteriota bacterium]